MIEICIYIYDIQTISQYLYKSFIALTNPHTGSKKDRKKVTPKMDTLGTSRVPRVKNPCFCPSQNKSWSKMTKEWPKACENWCLAKFSLENLFFEEHISPDSWIFLSKWNISTLPKPNTRQQLGPKLCWTTWRNGTVLDDFYLRLISQVMMLTSWNPNQPEINGWFFLFATHESLCNKWLFHQTSLYFCLFGVAG
jgi:hypothetical protein